MGKFKFIETGFQGLLAIEPTKHIDTRGYFMETYNRKDFLDAGIMISDFVQDNQSSSTRKTLRGLHFQTGEHAQAKLVRCLDGTIMDVVVDLRKDQPTFGQYFKYPLFGYHGNMLLVPRGFAHGFVVLSPHAIVFYKANNYYCKEAESGIIFNDPDLNIEWGFPTKDLKISDKDASWGRLKDITVF
jgi:dTDP-4-dehydrorhamnose 3,5-epimerase